MPFADALAAAGLVLPTVPAAAGVYVPAVRTGRTVFTAGQLPVRDGRLVAEGVVGASVTPGLARECAAQSALNALAAAGGVLDSLDRVVRVVKVVGFVASAPGFTGQAGVVDGASELLGTLLGERARHARSAVGVAALPLDAPVEIELVLEVED
jgi:enamine deaminase RidA (YjgF/YER057c/UK114 family)